MDPICPTDLEFNEAVTKYLITVKTKNYALMETLSREVSLLANLAIASLLKSGQYTKAYSYVRKLEHFVKQTLLNKETQTLLETV